MPNLNTPPAPSTWVDVGIEALSGTRPRYENYRDIAGGVTGTIAPTSFSEPPRARRSASYNPTPYQPPVAVEYGMGLFNDEDSGSIRLQSKQAQVVKAIVIDKEMSLVIKDLYEEYYTELFNWLTIYYQKQLDKLEQSLYNGTNDDEREEEYSKRQDIKYFSTIWQELNTDGSTEYRHFFTSIENLAREKYDIEYSKYRFYPRLKAKVNYGNAELLTKILDVTKIRRGKVILCK